MIEKKSIGYIKEEVNFAAVLVDFLLDEMPSCEWDKLLVRMTCDKVSEGLEESYVYNYSEKE